MDGHFYMFYILLLNSICGALIDKTETIEFTNLSEEFIQLFSPVLFLEVVWLLKRSTLNVADNHQKADGDDQEWATHDSLELE